MVYAVAVAPDYRSDETVLVLEVVEVTEPDDDIAEPPVPVRNLYAHDACAVIEQLHGRAAAVDYGVELCRLTGREVPEVGNCHSCLRRAGKEQRKKSRRNEEVICFHTSSITGNFTHSACLLGRCFQEIAD